MDSEFWQHTIGLFCGSVILAAILRGIYFHIMSGQVVKADEQEEYRSKGTRSCSMGCVVWLLLMVIGGGGFSSFFTDMIWKSPRSKYFEEEQKKAAIQINPLTEGPLSVLAKEKPLLFEHYCELERAGDALERLQEAEEDTRNAISHNRAAREKLSKNIAQYRKSIKRYAELRKKVETQAGYLYFARFFSNLGRRFNESELLNDLNSSELELKQELLNRSDK